MIESFNKKELEEKIDQYINGQLSAQEVDELWAELIQDGYHLDYLKSVANLKAVIEQKREEQKSANKKRYWYYAAAAVIALLIAVVGVMNISTQQQTSVEPISSIELDYYRSGDGTVSADPDMKVIQDAIKLANTGRENEAISLLQSELENATEPAWIAELSLNLGSLHYNNGNYSIAIKHYERVVSYQDNENVDVLMLEKAYWYIGNAYFHLDQLVDAKTNIEKAYELNGAYRRVAQSYLNALSE
ncbi:tetratricopeptide repeat protein [Fodinibius sp. SL11]|uniref:tetratricopeptide repeat protein n=1 Tax=Fodinibius sp. SL11 TaxID=3425690 RepID=UPI003F885C60